MNNNDLMMAFNSTTFYKLTLKLCMALILLSPENKIIAQQEPPDTSLQRENAIRLFIDCEYCDMNYIRNEIPYVNYVRDVREAEVYLLETMEITGSGGRKYTYTFVGQEEFQGINDTLVYSSRPDDPRDLTRMGRTQIIKMGLMPYVARSPLFNEVEIVASEGIQKQEVMDRWNSWVFELQAQPDLEWEESVKELQLRSSISAMKVTHDWKIEFDYDTRYTRTRYNYEDSTYLQNKNSQRFNNLFVRSIGEHWAAGLRTDLLSSS
jgi:hypothetical protein